MVHIECMSVDIIASIHISNFVKIMCFFCVDSTMTDLNGENNFSKLRKPDNGECFSAVIRIGGAQGFGKIVIKHFKVTAHEGCIRETGLSGIIKNYFGSTSSLTKLVRDKLVLSDNKALRVPERVMAYKVIGRGQCLLRCIAAKTHSDPTWLRRKSNKELSGWCCSEPTKHKIMKSIEEALKAQWKYLGICEADINDITDAIFQSTIEHEAFNFYREQALLELIYPFANKNKSLSKHEYRRDYWVNLGIVANNINDNLIKHHDIYTSFDKIDNLPALVYYSGTFKLVGLKSFLTQQPVNESTPLISETE